MYVNIMCIDSVYLYCINIDYEDYIAVIWSTLLDYTRDKGDYNAIIECGY